MTNISNDSEAPAAGQQVFTACAFIHQKFEGMDKVFMAKRADTKKFLPGVYELPGGHVEFGEEMIGGLKRELMEEFGQDISVGDPFAVFTYLNEIKGSHSVEVIYFAEFTDPNASIRLNPVDHSDYAWFDADNLYRAASSRKTLDDAEFQAIRKGFALLQGLPPAYR